MFSAAWTRRTHVLDNNNNKHTYAGQLNSFTPLRALLVLHDRGIYLAQATSVAGQEGWPKRMGARTWVAVWLVHVSQELGRLAFEHLVHDLEDERAVLYERLAIRVLQATRVPA